MNASIQTKKSIPFKDHPLCFKIHEDGSYDIKSPGCCLEAAYVGIDGSAIHPVSIDVEESAEVARIRYHLTGNRSIHLTLRTYADRLTITMNLEGFGTCPHWVSPIIDAKVRQISKLFRTGIGFSGPTNLVDLQNQPAEYSFESYLVTGLVADNECTVSLGAFEHSTFLSKAHLHNQLYRHNFRNREVERNDVNLEFTYATECVSLDEKKLRLPEVVISAGPDPWNSLRNWTRMLAEDRKIKPNLDPCYHFCSWYERGPNFCQNDLEMLLGALQEDPVPFKFIQIDDGYEPSPGDWLEPRTDLWPGGIKEAFRKIKEAGYRPGIWVAPFMVGSRSHLATEHPDWLLRDRDGNLIIKWKQYDGGGIPTHTDEETYILDTSHPAAMNYIIGVFRTLHEWGARAFKTDFIEWGYIDSTKVRRARPGRTSAQYYNEVMYRIREAIGDSYWLGCISFFAPMIGFCDGIRVSSDVGVEWTLMPSTVNNGHEGRLDNVVEETYGCHFFNNILWQNDPDVTYIRAHHISLSLEEIKGLAYFNAILGVSINTSCRIPQLTSDRKKLWKFLRPQKLPFTGRLLGWPHRTNCHTATRSFPELNAHALLVFNQGDTPVRDWLTLENCFDFKECEVFLWGFDGSVSIGRQTHILYDLPPHHCQLYYLTLDGNKPPENLSLGGHLSAE